MTHRVADPLRRAVATGRRKVVAWMLGDSPGAGHDPGWAARSLGRSLLVAVLSLCCLWILLLIPLVLEPWRGGPLTALAVLHVAVAVLLGLAVVRRLPAIVPIVGQFVLVVLGAIARGDATPGKNGCSGTPAAKRPTCDSSSSSVPRRSAWASGSPGSFGRDTNGRSA